MDIVSEEGGHSSSDLGAELGMDRGDRSGWITPSEAVFSHKEKILSHSCIHL